MASALTRYFVKDADAEADADADQCKRTFIVAPNGTLTCFLAILPGYIVSVRGPVDYADMANVLTGSQLQCFNRKYIVKTIITDVGV